jgi:8-oxo-dGTP pyrophosphatase MutT (NUDIX family)
MSEPEAAVAIVQTDGPKEAILLIRRAEREGDSWSGHWSFPGGRRDPEDPNPLHTALRELEEECGIRLTADHMQAALPHTIARRNAGPYLLVAPFLFRIEREIATELDPREAAGALWVPLSVLRDLSRHCLRPVPGRPREMLFPCIDLVGTPLWGFTYRLILDWLGLSADTHAGFEAASHVLQFLTSEGLPVESDWHDDDTAKVAAVKGSIPIARVLEQFEMPGGHFAAVNCLEVGPRQVRILGPAWEEYRIQSSS